MLSKNKIKHIRSLEQKKHRTESGTFVAEGNKLVADLLPAFACEWLAATPSWMATQGDIHAAELVDAAPDDIRRASLLKNPQDVIALFRLPEYRLEEADPSADLVLVLDDVQDPGNLGTIVRIADWFGIRHVVCSPATADAFAPKAVQATMGALAHVRVHYTGLAAWLQQMAGSPSPIPCYGAFLEGADIYTHPLSTHGLLVVGNEGNGISADIALFITEKLFIPSFPPGAETSESLNVASATAILCSEFRRR